MNNLKENRQNLSNKVDNLEESINNQFKVIEDIKSQISKIDVKKIKNRIWNRTNY